MLTLMKNRSRSSRPMLTLMKNRSRSSQVHDLFVHCSTCTGFIDVSCHVLLNWSTSFGEEDFLKVFTIYVRGGHLGHMTWIIYIYIGSPFK